MNIKRLVVAFFSGIIFALGLGISGMTDPNKVLGFLDLAGDWDSSLALVMAAAVIPNIFVFRRILSRKAPSFDVRFHLVASEKLSVRLIFGSALFGLGWGLSGYCPGPAIVSSTGGAAGVLAFAAAMIVGAFGVRMSQRALELDVPSIETVAGVN